MKWPIVCATAFFLALLAVIAPWSELPLNDDWQYAHVAKNLAERGNLALDIAVAPSLVGQSLMAWPVIRAFGFSHLALRLLTVVLSILMLFEIDYLLSLAAVSAGLRFVALCTLIANPLFLHFSTSFMTENYGYFVALLAACVWFYGRRRNSASLGVLAGAIAGFGFWIRQFSAVVFPALIIAEFVASKPRPRTLRPLLVERGPAITAWVAIVAAYFAWAKATGHFTPQFGEALARILRPAPIIDLVEFGVFVLYLTFFFVPFLLAYAHRQKVSIKAWIIPAFLIATAGFAWRFGDRRGSPSANLHSVFPFLPNVFTMYGVGPITLTDVYWEGAQTRPRVSIVPWMALEAGLIALSVAWVSFFARVRVMRSEIGVFGICFALLSFCLVVLSYQDAVFDRYHYPGILGFTLALAVFFPKAGERRLRRAALVWVGALTVFSTLALHDYFRWNEARAALIVEAQQRGITLSQIDAGPEPNGWNALERVGTSADCGPADAWFCRGRPFRIGLHQAPADSMILSRPVSAWLLSFPDLKLLQRHQ